MPFQFKWAIRRLIMHEASLVVTQPGHESSVFGTSRIFVFSAALAVLIILTALIAIVLVGGFRLPRPPAAQSSQSGQGQLPEVPRLQNEPASDLRTYRQEKEALLQQYRWIDRSTGRVQIPIDRAMQLTVERDLARGVPSASAKAAP